MKLRNILLYIIIAIFSVQLVGCSNSPKENSQSKEQDNSPPISLLELSMSANKIIDKLEKEYETLQKEMNNLDTLPEEENSEKKSDNKNSENEGSNKEKKMKELERKLSKTWEKINEEVKKLHQSWNSYESEELLNQKLITSIEAELNDLTELATKEKLLATLLKVNEFNLQIANLYNNYDSRIESTLKKVQSYTRDIMYLSLLNDTKDKQAEELQDINKIKDLLLQIEFNFEKDEKMKVKVKELKKAVEDLEQAVEAQSKEVIKVKSELVLKKVEELKGSG